MRVGNLREGILAMRLIGTILMGLVAGWLAKVISPGKVPGGLLQTAALGIGGSVVATYLAGSRVMHFYPPGMRQVLPLPSSASSRCWRSVTR